MIQKLKIGLSFLARTYKLLFRGLLGLLVFLNLYVIFLADVAGEKSINRSRVYAVANDQEEILGYVLGSMHTNLTEKELQSTQHLVENLSADVDRFYCECIIGHWSQMPFGFERVFQEVLERKGKLQQLNPLESIDQQQAMLSTSFYFGSKRYQLPIYQFYETSPSLVHVLSTFNALLHLVPNIIYKNIIHPSFQNEFLKKETHTLSNMRMNFLSGKTGEYSSDDLNAFHIIQRDQKMFSKFEQIQGALAPSNKFLIVVGCVHLSAEKGILHHFENAGFKLKPLNEQELPII